MDKSRKKTFDLLDKLKENREIQKANYKILGGVGFLGKYYFDPKDGAIKMMNVFEESTCKQVW